MVQAPREVHARFTERNNAQLAMQDGFCTKMRARANNAHQERTKVKIRAQKSSAKHAQQSVWQDNT